MNWLFNNFYGFSGVCFWNFCFCLTVLNHHNIVKHFSGSLIATLLPNCLLFHFFFVKITQSFLFCCFPKTNGAASLPLHLCLHQHNSTHSKLHRPSVLGRGWGAGTGKDGMGSTVAGLFPAFLKLLPQPPASHYLMDLLTSSAPLSCLYTQVPYAMKLVEPRSPCL